VRRGLIATVLGAIVLAGVSVFHTPLVAISPGPAVDVLPLVKIRSGAQAYPPKGSLFLLTVYLDDRIPLYRAVQDWGDPTVEVLPRDNVVPPGVTDKEQDQINAADMEESKFNAICVGLKKAGYVSTCMPDRVEITTIRSGYPAEGLLEPGDVVVAVDGTQIKDAKQAADAIGVHKVGEEVRLTISRSGIQREVVLKPVKARKASDDSGRPLLGITLTNRFKFPVDVEIDTSTIGGPSAGMMFSLAVYDVLTPGDLSSGRRIAGTGAIDSAGNVGAIGGVQQKIYAALRAHASVFLVPKENLADARTAARGRLTLVPISTVDDAISYLQSAAKG